MSKAQKAYCISCGEQVPLEIKSIGIEGEEIFRCKHCGAFLGTAKNPPSLTFEEAIQNPILPQPLSPTPSEIFLAEDSKVNPEQIPFLSSSQEKASASQVLPKEELLTPLPLPTEKKKPPIDTIIIAEDSELIRLLLKDIVVEKGLSQKVISCKNGFEFVASYIQGTREHTNFGLAILDVIMPVLNGISAAVAIRSYEKSINIEPIPLLFFTSKRCDQPFKKVLLHTKPAMYINKGTSSTPREFQTRVEKLINQLLKQSW